MERLRAHRSCLHQPCDLAPELVDEGNFRRAERAGTAAHKHVAVARGAAAGLLHQLLLGQDLKGNGAHPHIAARHIPQNVKLAAAVKYGDAALPAACRLRGLFGGQDGRKVSVDDLGIIAQQVVGGYPPARPGDGVRAAVPPC